MDSREISTIIERVNTRFRRRLAGDRLFIPDELGALARAAAGDPPLWPVVNAGRAHWQSGSAASLEAWDTACQTYMAPLRAPLRPPLPPEQPLSDL